MSTHCGKGECVMEMETPLEKILIVEDEPTVRAGLETILECESYSVRVVGDGQEAVEAVKSDRPDLVLLDVMMPKMNGYTACRLIRELDRELPILFLSAIESVPDQVFGLDLGADDFITKVCPPRMLLARIRSALARTKRFSIVDVPHGMTKYEANVYRLLKSKRGQVFSFREIGNAMLGGEFVVDEGALRTMVSRLRKKLPKGEMIRAKRGRGYCLV